MTTTTPDPDDEQPQFRLPPETLRALSNSLQQVGPALEAIQRSIAPSLETIQRSIAPSLESLQRSLAPSVQNLQRSLAPALASLRIPQLQVDVSQLLRPGLEQALAEMRRQVMPVLNDPQFLESLRKLSETVTRYYPKNWVGVDVDADDALRLAQDEGLPRVWVPRGELVLELLGAADAAARRALLEARADDIVSDCAEAAAGVSHAALQEHRKRLIEATEAHRAGLHGPAQAMSAVVTTALLQWVYAHEHLRQVKKSEWRAPADADELAFRVFKVTVLIEAAVLAIQGGRDALPDEKLDRFNRHDTLHRVADEAYVLPNAMTALMLATGLLAEADQLLTDGSLTYAP
jgi:hypothetical protein